MTHILGLVVFGVCWSFSVQDFNSHSSEELGERIRTALRDLAHGELHTGDTGEELPTLDPVHMTNITFTRGYGPVRADIFFPSSTLAGVGAVDEVSSIRCLGRRVLEFDTHHKAIIQDGLYNMTGNFGRVFASGRGVAYIRLKDVTIHHKLQWRLSHGEPRIRDYQGAVEPRHMRVHYSNLRSETRDVLDEECKHRYLHTNANKYFNDNWRDLYGALSTSVDSVFSAVFRDYMDVVLQRIWPDLQGLMEASECE